MRSEGFCVNEKSTDTAGIEPATFRFVAQHLNHCATAVPLIPEYIMKRPVYGGQFSIFSTNNKHKDKCVIGDDS